MPAVGILTTAVPLIELVAATNLVVFPRAAATTVLISGLGLAFASAGAVALWRGGAIRCACYGQSETNLGTRQLLALPVWFAVAAVSRVVPEPRQSGVAQMTMIALILAISMAAMLLLPLALRNRSYLNVMETQARYQLQHEYQTHAQHQTPGETA
jgi:hypothetical protein